MTHRDLALAIQNAIMDGVDIKCISVIFGLSEADIMKLFSSQFTNGRTMSLLKRAKKNNDFSAFSDTLIDSGIFSIWEGRPFLYSTLIRSDMFVKIIVFQPTGVVHVNPFKNDVEYFSEDRWCIIARKESNSLGLRLSIFGPGENKSDMERKSFDSISSTVISEFTRKAYNVLYSE